VYTAEQVIVTYANVKFAHIDEEGNAILVSERVKKRYEERLKMFGKGLLKTQEAAEEAKNSFN
jgi:hypothetical protein